MKKAKGLISIWLIVSCILFFSFKGVTHAQEKLDLHDAVVKGDIELAKKLIAEKKGINVKNESGVTPLMLAAEKGPLEIVAALLNAGAIVNETDKNGSSPLMYAALEGNVDIAELLIERNAHLDVMNRASETPLIISTIRGKLKMAETLLDSGAAVNRGNSGYIPLWYASRHDQSDIAKLLIERGAKINKENYSRWNPLTTAIYFGNTDVARILIENGAKVNIRAQGEYTPLMIASWEGNLEIARLLIEKGAHVDAYTNTKWTPLMYAVSDGHKEVTELLIEKGADIHRKNKDKSTTLILAAGGGNIDIVKMLIEKEIPINKNDGNLNNALCNAFANDHDDVGAFLLEEGAKLDTCLGVGTGDNPYSTGKSYMFAAKKCEEAGDVATALEHYSKAAKFFEKATPKLMKLSEKYGKGETGSILVSLLGLAATVAATAADLSSMKKGEQTDYLGLVRDAYARNEDIPPNEQKKIEYAEKSKRSHEYFLKCQENIERLKKDIKLMESSD